MSDHSDPDGWTRVGSSIDRRTLIKAVAGGTAATGFGALSSHAAKAQSFDDLCEAIALDVVLVLDRSGSMGFDPDGDGNTKLDDLKDAATGFVNQLTATDRVGLVSFSDTVTLNRGLTDDFDAVKSDIGSLRAGGSTNLGGAVDTGDAELSNNARPDATRILVVQSNGLPNQGPDPVGEAEQAKSGGIRVLTVALGSDADDALLREMASTPTGDNFFDVPDGDDLDAVFNSITRRICPAPVEINIKPGSDPNAVNCGSNGVVPVAVLTTESFDATEVDPSSVRFGAPDEVIDGGGAEIIHEGGHFEDAEPDVGSKDGDTDFVGHFATPETGFARDDEVGLLVGKTTDGRDIAGKDSVKIVGKCGHGNPTG